MGDQAQKLRELMAGHDHAQSLPIQSERGLDKSKLWDWLKGELKKESEANKPWDERRGPFIHHHGDGKKWKSAEAMLERMERAETLAQFQQRMG